MRIANEKIGVPPATCHLPLLETPMPTRPPLRPVGIAFAFAVNLLLVTLALLVGSGLPVGNELLVGLPLAASIIAGLATAFYVGQRAAIHAALGGLLSVPVLALFVLPNANWNFAVLTAAFCAVGGILGELHQRRAK
ncbi:MAG: hypothetical protein KJZ86_21650 [Caldilineaceae bacterium]|nr:hypothetical protein [Caldilineaceae bacterium]